MAERPPELVYSLDEKPPPLRSLLVAAQHAAIICPTLVIVAIIVHGAGASPAESQQAMARGLLSVAVMTVLQALGLRWLGSGFFLPPVVTATYLPAGLAAGAVGGMPLIFGMTIVAGIFQAAFSRTIGMLRKIFPAVVSGVILMAVAMELCRIGMSVIFNRELLTNHDFHCALVTALATLIPIVALGVWGKGLPKLLCALVGIICGYLAAALMGTFGAADLDAIRKLPFFALPSFQGVSFAFDWNVSMMFIIAALANGLRTVGVLTTCEQLNDAAWKRPNVRRIESGVLADSLGCVACGLLGTAASAASPSLVGVQKTTGVTSRVIAWYVAGTVTLLACLPMLTMFIVKMPKPVMGAALFFNGAMMFVAGLQVATSRPLTLRSTILIGFSVMLGLGSLVFPAFFQQMPPLVRQLTNSPISMAVVFAVGLNLIFLLGRWRFGSVKLHDASPGENFREFVDRQARMWKIPPEEASRVRTVTEDVLSQIHTNVRDGSDITLKMAFDDYDVVVEIHYEGSLPSLTGHLKPRGDLIEEQSFAAGLSGYLSMVQSDRVDTRTRGEQCELRLLFKL